MKGGAAGATRADYLRIFGEGAASGLDDGRLLERFAATRDEAAFGALVDRLGPTVLGVCRRILGAGPDADDAFQATFLVLVRRAGTIRTGEPLAPWLHGVALKVARRARHQAALRLARERSRGAVAEGVEDDRRLDRLELRGQIDEEIARLPEHHRRAVLLCDVEGLSREEAASRLGWTPNMVRGRLDRARARLRDRLARRGLAPSDATSILLGPPLLPRSPLVLATIRAALNLAAGRALIPGPALALSQGVIRMMMLAQWKPAAASLIGAVALLGASGLVASQDPGPGPGLDPAAAAQQPPASDPVANPGPAELRAASEGVARGSVAIGQARVEAARRRLEAQVAFYEEGRITIDRLIDASQMMMDAELAIAPTPEAREASFRVHLARLREIKKRETAEMAVGRATTADLAEAESRLLDAEFLLAREIEGRNPPPRAEAPPAPAAPPTGAVADLGRGWAAAAREQLAARRSEYQNARTTIDRVVAASDALMTAERETAGSKAGRDEAIRHHIDRLGEILAIAQALKSVGRATTADVAEAEQNLANARFLLAREADAPGPVPKPDAPPPAGPTAPGSGPNPPAAASPPGGRPAVAADLARQRVEVARRRKEAAENLFRNSRIEGSELEAALRGLLEAQLDVAETKAARVEIFAAMVAEAEKAVEITSGMVEAARVSPLMLDEARAAVLDFRIRLAREAEGEGTDLERRMTAVERKLDRIIEQLGAAQGAK